MIVKVFGQYKNFALFTDGSNAVVIDTRTNMVENVGTLSSLSSVHPWDQSSSSTQEMYSDLAHGALADLSIETLVSSGRMYTVPKAVQEEAKRALEWRKKHKRGGTPVGMNTARTLAKGGQVGIEKVRHIAKYFPRHEVDKKATGYRPGQDGFPSNGRIAWALWGGDAAWRWSKQIVERDNAAKKSMKASAAFDDYVIEFSQYETDLKAFREAQEAGADDEAPMFVARVQDTDESIDRLYMLGTDGNLSVWDGLGWDNLGQADIDISTMDLALDSAELSAETRHIFLDVESALVLSARFQQHPFSSVKIEDLDPEEYALVSSAAEEIDWELVDRAIVAAGEEEQDDPNDGNYTPKERAANAKKQVRDKNGRFAAMGSRVVVGGDSSKSGNITRIDSGTGTVTVKFDDGTSQSVPATSTEKAEDFQGGAITPDDTYTPLDTSGILGEPRVPSDRPNARIPGTLPALTSDQLQKVLYDYPAWVKSQRDAFGAGNKPTPPPQESTADIKAKYEKKLAKNKNYTPSYDDYREHPLFKNLFSNYRGKGPIVSAAEAPSSAQDLGEPLTPDTSDVQPMYLALVSPDDPAAVMDLISIVPASTKSTSPTIFKRVDGEWKADQEILSDLTSATPPPVVPLHGEVYAEVLSQVDKSVGKDTEESEPLVAVGVEGGLDRNRGQAEKLRRYWLYGRGSLKIRWNTPGDWTRCYKNLAKYMGPRAKGYCSLRHKEATGVWPGSKFNVGKRNIKASAAYDNTFIATEEEFIAQAYMQAQAQSARERVLIASGAYEINGNSASTGSKFIIPVVIPEGVESGDGRQFEKGSITVRALPLPLLWQIKTGSGHDGSVVVGRIDHMERTDDGIGNAYGVFDTGAYGREAERLVREKILRGVSADLDQFEAKEKKKPKKKTEAGDISEEDEEMIGGDKIDISHARVMAVTIVPKPAFQECGIFIEEPVYALDKEEGQEMVPDGIYVEDMDEFEAQSIVACGILAGAIPVVPPSAWFKDPKLAGPTPLTVDDDGRVFGHIAAWHVNHIGMTAGTKPPKSKSRYAYFHTGVVRADDGQDHPVGQLTLAGGHASLNVNAIDAARHYDDTGSAIADVHAGEDSYGIWVAGSLRSNASPEQIRALRASAPSGDWRPIGGSLELVAVCQVNVPGFPIARARVASGQVYALVAAGAQVLARMKNDPLAELTQRIATLEAGGKDELASKAEAARQRVKGATLSSAEDNSDALVAAAQELSDRVRMADYESLGYISMKDRKKLAKEGKALPDGSYPISNESDLKNAIQAYGRSKPSRRAAVRRHIMKKARAMDKADLIPEKWKSASIIDEEAQALREYTIQLKEGLLAVKTENTEAVTEKAVLAAGAKYISGKNQPRDAKGKFRQVLARIKQDLGTSGIQNVVEKVEEAENLDDAGNYAAAVQAATDLMQIFSRLDSGSLNPESVENVREAARQLGAALANLPLPFDQQTNKVRYSDLPPVLRNLIEDMIEKVEEKIGVDDANEATKTLKNYMSGGDVYSQSEVSGEMSKMMRLLT
jgi:hypothetical protein